MFSQVTLTEEAVVTNVTFEWFLFPMCNKTRVYFLSVIWRLYMNVIILQNIVSMNFFSVFSVTDYFIGIVGWFQWAISILKLLTCKCNPQCSTRSFKLTFHLIGGDWGGPNPFPWRRNVGVVGTSGASEFHESNAPTCNVQSTI